MQRLHLEPRVLILETANFIACRKLKIIFNAW